MSRCTCGMERRATASVRTVSSTCITTTSMLTRRLRFDPAGVRCQVDSGARRRPTNKRPNVLRGRSQAGRVATAFVTPVGWPIRSAA